MLIQNGSISNELFVNGALNPKFFGVTSLPSQSRIITVTPPPVIVSPPDQIVEGIVVKFPSYPSQPPAIEVVVPSVGGDLKNTFESVGIINPGGQIRLCALVRPNVIAAAHHYNETFLNGQPTGWRPYIGMTVAFGAQTAIIRNVVFTADDFECYQLDRSITSVQPAPIAALESASAYVNREITVFGLLALTRPVAAKTNLKYAFGNGLIWTGTASNKTNQPLTIQAGDSGSPVFIVSNGAVAYFGSLAAVNPTNIIVNIASSHATEIAAL